MGHRQRPRQACQRASAPSEPGMSCRGSACACALLSDAEDYGLVKLANKQAVLQSQVRDLELCCNTTCVCT